MPEVYVGKVGPCPACRQNVRLVAPNFAPGTDDFLFALVIVAGPERVGEQVYLGGRNPITIGKRPENDIALNDPSVSRYHCRLIRTDEGWRIEDEGSKNGVRINGNRVTGHDLSDADMIRLGHFTLQYEDTSAVQASGGASRVPASFKAEAHSPEDDLYALAEMEETQPAAEAAPPAVSTATLGGTIAPAPVSIEAGTPGPICPSCEKRLATGAKICVECGIDLKTGRAVLTTYDGHLDSVYEITEQILRMITWLIWVGIYPVASEALGIRKPYVIRAIAVITVLTSIWFWMYEASASPKMMSYKNLLLWCGETEPTAELVEDFYAETSYGDAAAFDAKLAALKADAERRKPAKTNGQKPKLTSPAGRVSMKALIANESAEERDKLVLAAYRALTPEQQCLGRYRPSQLITHAFLHADLMHLVGNLIFLLVIGSRINALIGNIGTAVLYPVLAIVAGLAHMSSTADLPPHPMLGASGAIMGLAGMYLVLVPTPSVHMVAWFRWGLIRAFHLSRKFFAVRGFWVVLFYIAFDVVATVFGSADNVAHWAHLGGFLAGVSIGLALLFSRLVNCRGGDIVSAVLGRRAWGLVGKPNRVPKIKLL
jgi:membrane associated rhomboid family serine protease/pSer/pThr/pTyr-binding forkhead associated (FHA) protein